MALIHRKEGKDHKLTKTEYSNEFELRDFIFIHPEMIMDDGESKVVTVEKEVQLPNIGDIDLLLVDEVGLPIVVETKLRKNQEARRVVVGQVFDYVSALIDLTVDELNRLVDNKLEESLWLISDNDEERFDKLWDTVGTNLRAGKARVVVVIDKAPDDLVRILRFLNEQSKIDVRLVEIPVYISNNGQETIHVPNLTVHGGGLNENRIASVDNKLSDVTQTYIKIADKDYPTWGRSSWYRFVKPKSWKGGIHYEFLQYADMFGVELHLESDSVIPLKKLLMSFEQPLSKMYPEADVKWDPKWNSGKGRIYLRFPLDKSSVEIAEAMKKLIEFTSKDVVKALRELNHIKSL
jgi:hypothetical protein